MSRYIVFPCLLLLGLFSIAPSAYATNDGHLDGVWLNARIKTSIPKAVNFAGSGPFAFIDKVPVDTGKDNCFVLLTWNGSNSFSYNLDSFCLNGNGLWERAEYSGYLYEVNDAKQSLASDWSWVYFTQLGRVFTGFPTGFAYTGYEGTLILTPTFNKKGELKSIKATSANGMIYSWDNLNGTGGTSKPTGFKLKLAKLSQVPAGAIACAAGGAAPLCP